MYKRLLKWFDVIPPKVLEPFTIEIDSKKEFLLESRAADHSHHSDEEVEEEDEEEIQLPSMTNREKSPNPPSSEASSSSSFPDLEGDGDQVLDRLLRDNGHIPWRGGRTF
jgi:hypothetical protein